MPFWKLYYHMVWATKGREALIQPRFEADLYRVIAGKAANLGGVVQAVGGIEDHVHLVVSVPPAVALSTFIGQVKGNSSHFVNHECGLDHAFAWQAEYGVLSFDAKKLDGIVKYVKAQREHHHGNTTIPILERASDDAALHQ
ncbi:MAG TPA: IS200/IS605 family transposase [Anaerolineae bacterium]|nr:IS200/IS605 family transposase [Anaerolineae bacterium]HOQ99654.1 IS200/IS605 family transposase [Anaerolineae bacterium]HPL26760.1 IS200/IS605 family transposase [Anaerolineae bacterium]